MPAESTVIERATSRITSAIIPVGKASRVATALPGQFSSSSSMDYYTQVCTQQVVADCRREQSQTTYSLHAAAVPLVVVATPRHFQLYD